MTDKQTRTMATIAISIALVSLVISAYALYLQSRSLDQLEALSDSLDRAIEVRPIEHAPIRPPRPALDDGEDDLGAGSGGE